MSASLSGEPGSVLRHGFTGLLRGAYIRHAERVDVAAVRAVGHEMLGHLRRDPRQALPVPVGLLAQRQVALVLQVALSAGHGRSPPFGAARTSRGAPLGARQAYQPLVWSQPC